MTADEAKALGLRWIAAHGGWRDGMLCARPRSSWRVLSAASWPTDGMQWPDFRDPATVGAALAVVRERWNEPRAHLWPGEGGDGDIFWLFRLCVGGDARCEAATEAECLVIALEQATKYTMTADKGGPDRRAVSIVLRGSLS